MFTKNNNILLMKNESILYEVSQDDLINAIYFILLLHYNYSIQNL